MVEVQVGFGFFSERRPHELDGMASLFSRKKFVGLVDRRRPELLCHEPPSTEQRWILPLLCTSVTELWWAADN
jgi:hypothetical protein